MMHCLICKQEHDSDQPCPPVVNPPEKDPLLLRVIDDKYELEWLISKGGMASIYSARRLQIGDEAAVKILRIDDNLDPVSLKRFQLEATAAASIKHQNIVAIHDFGLLDDMAYIVMEKLEGPALSKVIRTLKGISVDRSLRIFKQVAAAVSAAHKQGVIHRDLKPSNIIFQYSDCEDDLVKVVDFGIAKLIRRSDEERLTTADFAVGTPEYMSPEQCLGYAFDERSDIYSLGIVLYEMLSGQVPFYNPVASAILIQHAIETPRPLTRINPSIPTEIEAVVMKALSKDPEKRFRSAIEMTTEFELACRSASAVKQNRHSLPSVQLNADPAPKFSAGSDEFRIPEFEASKRSFGSAPTISGEMKVLVKMRGPSLFSFDRFVGRVGEMEKLEEYFHQAAAGFPRTIFITGDPGVGKTELVNRFQQKLDDSVYFLSGKFYEYGGAGPYRPYLDGLYSFTRNDRTLNERHERDPEGITTKIRQYLDEIDGLINVTLLKTSSLEEQIKYRTFELLAGVFKMLSDSAPLALFLDDIHWADSLSLEFLAYLIRNMDKSRLFILCTAHSQKLLDDARPIKTWLRRISHYAGYDQIKLSALSDVEARVLIDSIFGNIRIGESVVHRFFEVSEGNPFYLGEILRQLVQEQKIVWLDERWQCVGIEAIELPSSITDLVELHLKRLTDETIEVFTCAAAVGEKFSFQLLRKIKDMPKEALMEIIDIGLREFIVKESGAIEPFVDDYFVFYHSTMRKVLYERLSSYRRRRLHSQIGAKLESLAPRRLDRMSSELAYHFHHGGNQEKALYYSIKAGEAARSIFAVENAVEYYSWAEEWLEHPMEAEDQPLNIEPERIIGFRLGYGEALMYMGRNDCARKQFDKGLKLSREAGFAHMEAKTLRACGELAWSCGHYNEALGFCNSASELLSAEQDAEEECRLLGVMGNAYFSQGQFDQAVEIYNKKLKLARSTGDRPAEGEALRHLGLIMGRCGQMQEAFDCLTESLAIAHNTGNRDSEWQILMFMGNIRLAQGEMEKSAEYYKQSLAISRAIGRRRGECRAFINIGEICRLRDDLENAQAHFNEALLIASEIEDRETEGTALSNLGLTYKETDEKQKALECFRRALDIFNEINYHSNIEVEALFGIADIFLKQENISEACAYFKKAVSSGKELGLQDMVIPALRRLAECERRLGNKKAASNRFKEALEAVDGLINADSPESEKERFRDIKSEIIREM